MDDKNLNLKSIKPHSHQYLYANQENYVTEIALNATIGNYSETITKILENIKGICVYKITTIHDGLMCECANNIYLLYAESISRNNKNSKEMHVSIFGHDGTAKTKHLF